MRCFIAVDVDNPLMNSFIEELSEVGAALKLVKPENLHLTLKFLGEVAEDSIEGILEVMDDSLSGHAPFESSLCGAGAFPGLDYMRVVWVGTHRNREQLIEMQTAIDEKLVPLGFARDKRFHPHLTLARVKSQKGKRRLKAFISKNSEREFGNFSVDSVKLKKSVLTPEGPIYSTVGKTELTG